MFSNNCALIITPNNGNFNYKIAKENYGWKERSKPFDRTFRTFSNVDDMHENGIHDYLKFIKFGFGRGTDHANYEVRLNNITKEEGIKLVLKYDHIKPSDLSGWCDYVKMTEGFGLLHMPKMPEIKKYLEYKPFVEVDTKTIAYK